MKSIYGLTRYIKTCMSQQVIFIHMQPKQNILILGEDDNISENFRPHENKESTLEKQDIEGDYTNLIGKSWDTGNCPRDGLSRRILQDELLAKESSSSLTEVRFSKQEFSASKLVSNIKYYHPDSSNNNLFHPFNDKLDYALATYFAEFKTNKGNVNRFLSDSLMASFTKKLSYQNVDK